MGTLRILNGDFRSGRATFDNLSIELRGLSGAESVPLMEIVQVKKSGREKHVDGAGTLKQAAAGSILGGLAAGAVAGGITGPVGALLGAAAGAILTGRKIYPIAAVHLRDGRWFLAVAKETEWAMLAEAIRHAPRSEMRRVIDVAPEQSAAAKGARALLGGIQRRLPKFPGS
jgi:hypothetical protein